MADISIRFPMPGTPLDDPAWLAFWDDIAERTGGTTDKVEAASTTAVTAQTTATTAQGTAVAAQSAASDAQSSVAANLALINDLRFVTGAL